MKVYAVFCKINVLIMDMWARGRVPLARKGRHNVLREWRSVRSHREPTRASKFSPAARRTTGPPDIDVVGGLMTWLSALHPASDPGTLQSLSEQTVLHCWFRSFHRISWRTINPNSLIVESSINLSTATSPATSVLHYLQHETSFETSHLNAHQ